MYNLANLYIVVQLKIFHLDLLFRLSSDTYFHTYIYTHIHTYIHTYIRTNTHIYIRIYIHTYMLEQLADIIIITKQNTMQNSRMLSSMKYPRWWRYGTITYVTDLKRKGKSDGVTSYVHRESFSRIIMRRNGLLFYQADSEDLSHSRWNALTRLRDIFWHL